jgi:shikimate dehydrogenase
MKNAKPKAGVIGWPVEHSLSPRLFRYWLRQYGIEGGYEVLAIVPEKLEEILRGLPGQGFCGVNLTIPHKEAALKIVTHIEPLARRIGAINTIIAREDGSLEGRNTDAFGFTQNLLAAGVDVKTKPVTVLGAGGAARAVIVALQDMGVKEIRLVNRTNKRAEILAHELGGPVKYFPRDNYRQAMEGTGLLVNTTSVGMQPNDPSPFWDIAFLPKGAIVTDIVYRPLMTGLLKQAQERGHKIVDGLGMLLYQAQPGFEAWFGVKPEITPTLRAHMIEAL